MQKSEPKVTENRSVYKRIAIGSEYVKPAPAASTGTEPNRIDANAERVWRQVVRTSGGDVPDEPAPQPEPEPVNVYEHLGPYGMYGFGIDPHGI